MVQRVIGVVLFLLAALCPAVSFAQASIAGEAADAQGAVLPGVTVDVSSPALIEGTRTAVTDGSGRFRVEALRPGVYVVTFALPGFVTVKREAIEVVGTATTTVNAELRVGAQNETVTVTGEVPTVDTRNVRQERVLGREFLDALPFGRTPQAAALLTPGASAVSTFGAVEIGGTNIIMTGGGLTSVHGSRGGDSRVAIDGLSTSGAEGEGAFANLLANIGLAQEVTVSYAAGTAEQALGGVQTNIIPREGGNDFKFTFFASGTRASWQGANDSQDLRDRGLRTPNAIKETYDINPAVGGPIARSRLWFFTSGRWVRNANYVGGMFYNLNAGNPNAWTYEPDTTRPAFGDASQPSRSIRLTWQATARNKFSGFYDSQNRCQCSNPASTIAPEATSPGVAGNLRYSPLDMLAFGWTAPLTNRLLIEARTGIRRESYTFDPEDHPFVNLINVTEQLGAIPGLSYRGGGIGATNQPYLDTDGKTFNTLASATYVTGSHSFKVGFNNLWNRRFNHWEQRRGQIVEPAADYVAYRFSNGIPNQLTQRATPYQRIVKQPWDLGIYVQDAWTLDRLTVNAGLRFDHYSSYAPETTLGPGPLVPNRNITFPRTQMLSFKDITPRLGVTIDLFGDQKTALKVGLNKYMQALGTQVGFMNGTLDPVSSLALFVTRSWNDSTYPVGDPRRGNFVPDCDLVNVLANGECSIVSDTNFGQPTLSTLSDPATTSGWGNRPYQWEFSTVIDHQLAPRVSASAGFFRRTFGNFVVVDNLNLSATDFTSFSVVVPTDTRLSVSGQTIDGFKDRNPDTLVRPANNSVRLASEYGDQSQTWSGVDLSLNARLLAGATIGGGLSTGRTTTDNCDILTQVPEAGLLGGPYCRQVTDFLTDVKLQGAYTVPTLDVQLGLSYRNSPGPQISANYVATNASVRDSLGRDLSGGAANVTVNLVPPGTLFGDRLNQLDLRVGKVIRTGRLRTVVSVDVYNALNANPVLTENATYRDVTITGWRIPTSILPARFAKLGVQFDF